MVLSAQPTKQVPFETRGGHGATAVATATQLPKQGNAILVQAQVENVWYTLDGSDPNPTGAPPLGFTIVVGDPEKVIPCPAGVNPTFIGEAAGARLQFQWMKM